MLSLAEKGQKERYRSVNERRGLVNVPSVPFRVCPSYVCPQIW
jgi:hypothetical protein